MQPSGQCRHQYRSLGVVMSNEVDGDHASFLEMRNREKESSHELVRIHKISDALDDSPAFHTDCPEVLDMTLFKMNSIDNFLDADGQKSDHDWLLTPPRTPSLPLMELSDLASNQIATSRAVPPVQISKLENPLDVRSSGNDTPAMQPVISISDGSSASTNRKTSSARQKQTVSRSATPTARSTVPAVSQPSRSFTPTSRGIAASSKPKAPSVRSSTPTRVTARSATPPARPSIPPTTSNKSASRSSTPTFRSSQSSSGTTTSSAPSARSSSVIKTVPVMSRNTGEPRIGIVPMVKSRPEASPEAAPVISSDAPSNFKMTMPKRATSASRGRPTSYNSQFASSNMTIAKQWQKSYSPARERAKDGALDAGKTVLSRSRGFFNGSDDVNPVLMGTKLVKRVVNMRKLTPPKHDDDYSHDNSSGNSSSQDNSGFGRSLSKKSLEMAIRHMDIRRSISGNLKTIVTSVSASSSSSSSSRRAGSSKASTATSASDSPLATCSDTSSEPSVHNISHVLDMNDVDIYDIPN